MFKKSSKKIIYCLAFLLGIVMAGYFNYEINYLTILFFIPIIVLFWSRPKHIFIIIVLLSLAIGYIRLLSSYPVINEKHISFYNNQGSREWSKMRDTNWQGTVIDEPDVRFDHAKLKVASKKVKAGNQWLDVNGLVLVKVNLYPIYEYGDLLDINCKLITPDKIENFAYDNYLARYNIYSVCYGPTINIVHKLQPRNFKSYILNFKDKIHDKIKVNLVEPEASLFSAILLARRKGMPADLTNNFSRAGVSHLIAISGMHIAIMSMIIVRLLAVFYLPKKVSYPLTLILLGLYIVMIGYPASAVRAGLMGAIVLIADYFGRLNKSYLALLLVAVIILLINPKMLLYDVGFQLSFLAVLSLIMFSETMDRWFVKFPKLFGITAILKTTLAAQILTLPWIVYTFGQISLISPIANILLLPLLPLIMVIGLLAVAISFLWQPVAQIIFWILWYLLYKVINIINALGNAPLAALSVLNINIIYIVAIYSLIFLLKAAPRFKNNE